MKSVENLGERIIIPRELLKSKVMNEFYKTSENITELKLKIMDNKELSSNRGVIKYFKLDEEVIKKDLALHGIKLKGNKEGALIKQEQKISENLSYRVIEVGERWNQAGEWINFFFMLGRFIQQEKEINFFVNYLNRTIPSLLISMGIIDEYYSELNRKGFSNINNISDKFVVGDEISYLNDDGKWYKTKVVEVTELSYMPKYFNPYLIIRGIFNGENTNISVPHKDWAKRIRMGGVVSGSPGRSQRVYLNDRISEVIASRYSNKLVSQLKMRSKINVNLIGWGVDKKVRDFRNKIQFSDNKGSFLITDYLYLDNDNESNYVNVHMVASDRSDINQDSNSVSIFVGAKNGMNLKEHRSKRNVYITSRIRENYYEDTKLLINYLTQSSILTKKQKINKLDDFYDYLQKFNIEIPKGVEIYVF